MPEQAAMILIVRPKKPRVRKIYVECLGRHAAPLGPCAPWDRMLAPGDAVLYREDPRIEDLLIGTATGCPWIHAGMLTWNEEQQHWEIIDTRQWHGGCRTPLIDAVRANPGHWDLFRADAGGRWPEFNRPLAVAKMAEFVGRPYGWLSLVRDGLTHLPLLGAALRRDLRDGADDGALPFCSQAVAIATRVAGGIDVVPHRPDAYTEPVHLAQSLFYEYAGTFWPACQGEAA